MIKHVKLNWIKGTVGIEGEKSKE